MEYKALVTQDQVIERPASLGRTKFVSPVRQDHFEEPHQVQQGHSCRELHIDLHEFSEMSDMMPHICKRTK
jgi:hypothetical protein